MFKQSDIKAKYKIEEVLGTGNFAEVRLAVEKQSGQKVAVKIIELGESSDENIVRREIEILGKLKHPNIINLIEVFEKKSLTGKRKMFIVMDLVTGGELFDRIVQKKTFKESEARSIMKAVFDALVYMHSHGIAHRDLKPENLLFATKDDDAAIKVADFGLAKLYDPDPDHANAGLHTTCGTPGYVAPEVLRPADKKRGYDPQVDVWSAGVILYILLCGFPPFYEEDQNKMFRQIIKGNYTFPSPEWDRISPEAIDLVKRCLQVDPVVRITPVQALQHPWMTAESHALGNEIVTENLMKYLRRQKFKRVKNAILAVGRMQMMLAKSLEQTRAASSK